MQDYDLHIIDTVQVNTVQDFFLQAAYETRALTNMSGSQPMYYFIINDRSIS